MTNGMLWTLILSNLVLMLALLLDGNSNNIFIINDYNKFCIGMINSVELFSIS